MKRKKKISYPPEVQRLIQQAVNKQKMGLLLDAETIYKNILSRYPDCPDANHLYGVILFSRKNYESARTYIKKALITCPQNPEYLHNLGVVYKEENLINSAKKIFNLSIKADRKYSSSYNSLGSVYVVENRPEEAIIQFKKAIKVNPGYFDAIYNLALAFMLINNYKKAISEFELLLTKKPNNEEIITNLGDCYVKVGTPEKAIQLFQDAAKIAINSNQYFYKISVIYEASSELDSALKWIEKARDNNPLEENYIYFHAVIKRRINQFIEALSLLNKIQLPVSDIVLTQKIYFELGRLYDRTGDYEKAFENYKKGNRAQTDSMNVAGVNKSRFLIHLQKVKKNLNTEWLESWNSCIPKKRYNELVFMVAFPRSGTTLLDQILDSHSNIQVMEEQPILGEIIAQIVSKNSNYPNCLASLSCQEVQKYRKFYMAQVAKSVELQVGSILIDKLPLNIVEIELIQRLFPESKIILSLRHPYDVCLSNFMQHFDLNDAMANFLTLEDSAKAYRHVMELWQQYSKILPLSYITVRYENLVDDAESQSRILADFLGLEWETGMRKHVQHAKSRILNTPSYQQVTEDIYTRSKYRWKHYEGYVSVMRDDLKDLINHFGYSE